MLPCLQIQGRISLIEAECGRLSRNRAAPCCVEVPNDRRDRKLTALWNTAIGIDGFRTRCRLRCLSRASVYSSWKCGPCMVRPGFARGETPRGKIFMTCIAFITLSLSFLIPPFRSRKRETLLLPAGSGSGARTKAQSTETCPCGERSARGNGKKKTGIRFFSRQKTIPLVGF